LKLEEAKKLPLSVKGPVRFAVNGDKLRVLDEREKEHKETVLQMKDMDRMVPGRKNLHKFATAPNRAADNL